MDAANDVPLPPASDGKVVRRRLRAFLLLSPNFLLQEPEFVDAFLIAQGHAQNYELLVRFVSSVSPEFFQGR
eukprot:scaffold315733_cov33-Tisochrysis_lutea.AAC.1